MRRKKRHAEASLLVEQHAGLHARAYWVGEGRRPQLRRCSGQHRACALLEADTWSLELIFWDELHPCLFHAVCGSTGGAVKSAPAIKPSSLNCVLIAPSRIKDLVCIRTRYNRAAVGLLRSSWLRFARCADKPRGLTSPARWGRWGKLLVADFLDLGGQIGNERHAIARVLRNARLTWTPLESSFVRSSRRQS